nr:outer membrane beta-barrel protein [uncultured Bdellovibrio sp.]
MKKLLLVFALALGFTSVSHAGILIEPYLGYEMGKTKNPDGKFDGSQVGLRLAYAAPIFFWGGLDYTLGVSGTSKPDSLPNEDGKRSTLYGVVGMDFPILLRAWVGYGFLDEMKFENSGKAKGTSYKVGVGFTGLPFISLNLEYVNEKFTELEGVTIPGDTKNDSYVLSVSLPLEF